MGNPIRNQERLSLCNGKAEAFFNLRSRRGREWTREAARALEATGLEFEAVHAVRDPVSLANGIARAVEAERGLIVVAGGDGTLGLAANLIRNTRSTLGLLPFGTGNALARDLGIPPNVPDACRVLAGGRVERVDLGLANNRVFINVLTAGLSTQIARRLTDTSKRKMGRFVYLGAIVQALFATRPFKVHLKFPTEEETFDTLQIVVGNGQFHAGPFPLSPSASISDGLLEVYALAGVNRSAFIRFALQLRTGRHVDMPDVRHFQVPEGSFETAPSKRVTLDGEIFCRAPVSFKSLPGALRVVVPPDFAN